MTGDDHIASGVAPLGYRPEQHVTPGLRIGARVRFTATDDPFISYGEVGVITNTAPARPHFPARARVLFDSDCSCMVAATDLEIIPAEPVEPKPPRQAETSPFTNWQKQQEAS